MRAVMVCVAWMLSSVIGASASLAQQPREAELPEPPTEFRALWVATVANIDWPSVRGMPVPQMRAEMNDILDTAARTGYNAIVLQVRPAADVLYPSAYEPWSEFLTGKCGRPPRDVDGSDYDPLAEWIAGSHARGLELHAWFNPFRCRHKDARTGPSAGHVINKRPDIAHEYGEYWWMDPGHPDARAQTLNVMREVVRNYDVDGVHIDDYFYPYPERNMPFPDDAMWNQYVATGGTLGRDDWRRDNMNNLVRDMYQMVKREKSWVKVGISPFGFYRPDHPKGVRGFDQYERLYADARLWWREGWMDYCSPQLYWETTAPGQPFVPILQWWVRENQTGRHLWPGLSLSRVSATPGEGRTPAMPAEQMRIIERSPGTDGYVKFSMVALMQDRQGLQQAMTAANGPRAIVPESTWLDVPAGAMPPAVSLNVRAAGGDSGVAVWWPEGSTHTAGLNHDGTRQWIVWKRYGDAQTGAWRVGVLPPEPRSVGVRMTSDGKPLTAMAVRAVGVAGKQGPIAWWAAE